MHHTKDKGDIGVTKAIADLTDQGYIVSLPISEHAPFDLLITKDNVTKSVQVKARTPSKAGILSAKCKSYWFTKTGLKSVKYSPDRVDVYCFVNLDNSECYYLDSKNLTSSFSIRVVAPKNNQKANVKLAEDYRKVP
jgi:hypothetical protein